MERRSIRLPPLIHHNHAIPTPVTAANLAILHITKLSAPRATPTAWNIGTLELGNGIGVASSVSAVDVHSTVLVSVLVSSTAVVSSVVAGLVSSVGWVDVPGAVVCVSRAVVASAGFVNTSAMEEDISLKSEEAAAAAVSMRVTVV